MGVFQASSNTDPRESFKPWLWFLVPAGICSRKHAGPVKGIATKMFGHCYRNVRRMLGLGSCPVLSEVAIIAPL